MAVDGDRVAIKSSNVVFTEGFKVFMDCGAGGDNLSNELEVVTFVKLKNVCGLFGTGGQEYFRGRPFLGMATRDEALQGFFVDLPGSLGKEGLQNRWNRMACSAACGELSVPRTGWKWRQCEFL